MREHVSLKRKPGAAQRKYIEAAIVLLYITLHLLMAVVHEPWFDEAQAWQIARCASLKVLLTEVPHYEGHPPLWHLVLMLFAKTGVPYELSLTLAGLIFTGTAVCLILWFAPFPAPVRFLLPFTYFLFYQYGVISRVYCMMVLEFILLAVCHKHRNISPGRYVFVMLLMCVTNAYGLVLAGGISAVWLWEIWQENGKKPEYLRKVIHDKRVRYLTVLLFAAIIVILQIMPREDTYAMNIVLEQEIRNNLLKRLFYTVLILPADVTMTNVFADYGYLSAASLEAVSLFGGCVVGIIIWGMIIYFGKRNHTFCLFAIPYLMFSVFASVVYLSLHHIGIGFLFLIYWIWVSMETSKQSEEVIKRREPLRMREAVKTRLHLYIVKTTAWFAGLSLCISVLWSISACVLDVQKQYSAGRSMAEFIKEHRLEQYQIMAQWEILRKENGETESSDVNACYGVVEMAPYFEDNIVYNFNFGSNERNYFTHVQADDGETDHAYAVWKEKGYPDILLMKPELSALYDSPELSMRDYALVYYAADEKVWKNVTEYHGNYIYVKRDLLQETGLEEVQVHSAR